MKKIALVTVNYNGQKDTLELLESLKQLSPSPYQLKTIVVDNGSSDNCAQIIIDKYKTVEMLQNGQNLGFAGGYNIGIDYALGWGADYVLVINNDALISSPDLLTKLIQTAESDQRIGFVSPKIYFAKGYEFHKDRYLEENRGKVLWYAGGSFDWNNIMSVHRGINEVDLGQYDLVEEVKFVSGCCLLIKKEVLEKVGTFNTNYFAYFEDNELTQRAKEKGFKKFYDGRVSIFHKVSQTSGIGSNTLDYYLTRNRLNFGMKYASSKTKFALLRQSLGQLLFGRAYQKKAIKDFLAKKTGPIKTQPWNGDSKFQKELSIVSVNYNTPELIDNLLKSIYSPRHPGLDDVEVIIIDNASELSCASVMKKYPQAKFIQNLANLGFTGGNNQAFKYSKGRYILMLNPDIEIKEDSLELIVNAAKYNQDEAVVSGALYFPDGTLQDSVFYLPTITGALKEYFLGLKGSFFMYAPIGEQNRRVEAAAMACFLIPRKILNQVGLLNEKLFTYFEDVDYCQRLKKANIPVYYIPKAKFLHHHGATSKTLKQGKSYELLQNAAKIYYGQNYYRALSFVLKVCQKLSWVKAPVAR